MVFVIGCTQREPLRKTERERAQSARNSTTLIRCLSASGSRTTLFPGSLPWERGWQQNCAKIIDLAMNTKLIILEHWTLEHWTWASWTLHITLFLTCKIWCAYLLTEENKLERGIPLLLQPDRKHLFQVNMISRHACVHFTHCTFITMFFTMFGTNYKVFQTLHCKPCCFFKCCVKELIEW